MFAKNTKKSQVNGLVHISQLADEFVANCDDHVKEGDMVRYKSSAYTGFDECTRRCRT